MLAGVLSYASSWAVFVMLSGSNSRLDAAAEKDMNAAFRWACLSLFLCSAGIALHAAGIFLIMKALFW